VRVGQKKEKESRKKERQVREIREKEKMRSSVGMTGLFCCLFFFVSSFLLAKNRAHFELLLKAKYWREQNKISWRIKWKPKR
jgi:hypothetical protein